MSKLAKDDSAQAEMIDTCLNERNQFYGFDLDVTGLYWKFFAPSNLNKLDEEYENEGSFFIYSLKSKSLTVGMREALEVAYEEKPGVLSEDKCWVSCHEGYLYIADTAKKLAEQIINEFQNDKHLVM